jgi:hydroxyacylglutathione hydrolase
MIKIHSFAFGPFQENTYILHDETNECIVIDPGCYDGSERAELSDYITQQKLKPVRLINTHCHLDHVFGNKYVAETYNLKLEINKHDLSVLNSFMMVANMYNLKAEPSPEPSVFLEEGDIITFGNSSLQILFTPGHSPGSITFYNTEQKFMIVGDVLFYGSIGRTDLPGGDYDTLIASIKNKLLPMGDEYVVYNGHGPSTNIGFERNNNPFL